MAGSRGKKPFHLVSELNWGQLFGEPVPKKILCCIKNRVETKKTSQFRENFCENHFREK